MWTQLYEAFGSLNKNQRRALIIGVSLVLLLMGIITLVAIASGRDDIASIFAALTVGGTAATARAEREQSKAALVVAERRALREAEEARRRKLQLEVDMADLDREIDGLSLEEKVELANRILDESGDVDNDGA